MPTAGCWPIFFGLACSFSGGEDWGGWSLDGFGVGFWSGGFWWIVGCLDPGALSLFFLGLGSDIGETLLE